MIFTIFGMVRTSRVLALYFGSNAHEKGGEDDRHFPLARKPLFTGN